MGLLGQLVAHPLNGDDVAWVSRIGLDVPSQIRDVRVQRTLQTVKLITERSLEQLGARKCPTRRTSERGEHGKFPGGEVNASIGDEHFMPNQIHDHIPCLQLAWAA